jgi:hypothetical protein
VVVIKGLLVDIVYAAYVGAAVAARLGVVNRVDGYFIAQTVYYVVAMVMGHPALGFGAGEILHERVGRSHAGNEGKG